MKVHLKYVTIVLGIGMIVSSLFFISRSQVRTFSEKDFQLVDSFASNQYASNIPMEEIDWNQIVPLTHPEASVETHFSLEEFELTENIVYYKKVNGSLEKAFILEKGTRVYVDSDDEVLPHASGLNSFPTHQRGIRYAHPLIVVGEEADPAFYYVYLNDLEKAARALIDQDSILKRYIEMAGYSKKEAAARMVRYIDRIFYLKGIFCSLD